jgi:hypothetical protein
MCLLGHALGRALLAKTMILNDLQEV